ncbi:NfeD family protein [Bacteroidota bacterium]
MSLTAIILLIILGIILFYVEFLIIPGVTIAGIAGFILIAVGIYFGYKEFGSPGGHYIVGATAVISFLSVILMLRSKTWEKIALKAKIDSKSTSLLENDINVGDSGESVTRLNPYGKVLINDKFYEAKSTNSFIDPKTKIEVKKIDGTHLIVKPLN